MAAVLPLAQAPLRHGLLSVADFQLPGFLTGGHEFTSKRTLVLESERKAADLCCETAFSQKSITATSATWALDSALHLSVRGINNSSNKRHTLNSSSRWYPSSAHAQGLSRGANMRDD